MSELEKTNMPTGRNYSSVQELMKGEKVSQEVQDQVAELVEGTQLVHLLAKLRMAAGLTQEEMGKRLGIGQSAVSKLESGQDEELTIGTILEYSKVMHDQRMLICFGKPLNHVEAVKWHAQGIRYHLEDLARIAHQYDEMRTNIQAFFGEAFFNILNILGKCQDKMPKLAGPESEFRVHLVAEGSTGRKALGEPSLEKC